MQRRRFIQGAALVAAAGRVPTLAAAADSGWAAAFRAGLANQPWLLGFLGTDAETLGPGEVRFEGRLPAALAGTLYRNGPARHEIGGYRYHHWFDGDGMVQAFRIGEGRVSHRGRLVATRKVVDESLAGRPLYPAFASVPPDPRPVTSPDQVNVANISVLVHGGRLLALWEAGSPHELDPETLESRGTFAFSQHTRGAPFSAHPRVEPDGTLWNFGYVSSAGLLVFWHVGADGNLVEVGQLSVSPMSMPHDFVVTRRHLVILVPPLHFEPDGGRAFLEMHRWHPERPTRVLVVEKDDFSRHFWCELPAQWVFHFGNAWEDDAGVIRFDGARAADPMAMLATFRDVMRGEVVKESSPGRQFLYRIDTRKRVATEEAVLGADRESEFPTIDPRVSTRRHRRVVLLTASRADRAPHPLLNAVSTLDLETGRDDTWRYPDDCIPEEHLYVPDPAAAPETGGWVVGTFLDWRKGRSGLHVFAADDVASGPIATATLPYSIPLGLHGKFVHA